MDPLPSNRGNLRLTHSKPFWLFVSCLVLSVLICLYLLDLLSDDERRRIRERTFVVSIVNEGEFYLGRDKVRLDDLAPKVKQFRESEGTGQTIYLSPGSNVKQTLVTAVIELIQKTGHERIGLPTEISSGGLKVGSIDTSILVSTVRCDHGQTHKPSVVVSNEDESIAQTLSLNGRQIPIEELGFELKALFNRIAERIIYLRTGKDVSYGATSSVMSLIKRAGANEIAFEIACDDINANR
jgi:biopolymer transport protein ExbD